MMRIHLHLNLNYTAKFLYIKKELYDLEIIKINIRYGNKVKSYDLAITICDIIKNKENLDIYCYRSHKGICKVKKQEFN